MVAGWLNFLALLSLASPRPHAAACLRYEPDTVTVSGVLARRSFYGAPGFGEDPTHDEKEVGYYLELATPICTFHSAGNDATQGVHLVQLVLDSAGYARLRPLLGHEVTLRGTLFAAMNGHHHAPVLLQVLRPVDSEPRRS